MAKKNKVDLLDNYRIFNSYRDVPSSYEEQYKLVSSNYEFIKGGGSYIRVEDSNENQINRIAQRIVGGAYKKIKNLPSERLNVLKLADKADKTKDESDIERLCIMADGVCDKELSDVVDRVVSDFNEHNKRFLN